MGGRMSTQKAETKVNSKVQLLGYTANPRQRLYHQAVALFDALPSGVKSDPANQHLVALFTRAQEEIDAGLASSMTEDASAFIADQVYKLHAALLGLLPREDLVFRLAFYREEYRKLAGESAYASYLLSAGYEQSIKAVGEQSEQALKFLRADAQFLIEQINRHQALWEYAEKTRTQMLDSLWRNTRNMLFLLSVPILLFLADILLIRRLPILEGLYEGTSEMGETPLAKTIARLSIIGFTGVPGVLGAFVSALSRSQKLSTAMSLDNYAIVMSNTSVQLRWAPLAGVIFAGMITLIFGAGLVQGSLFPNLFMGSSWFSVVYQHGELAKLMVWCFIAGFSERFVPGLLDRFVQHADEDRAKAVAVPQPLAQGSPKS